ncbi:MAG: ABC transporter permease [Lachnospiraceae bacterium]|jgi:ribose transport system permease protein|nr:ABC transporter permease [Lachnospiraceae bacterium]
MMRAVKDTAAKVDAAGKETGAAGWSGGAQKGAAALGGAAAQKGFGRAVRDFLFSYNSAVIFAALLVFATFFVNKFSRNYSTVIFDASIYGCIAIGLSLVMVTGNIDLSVGFQAALGAVVVVQVSKLTGSLPLGVICGLAAGAVCGALNGAVVTRVGISPLIATIASNYIFKGIVYYFTKNGSIYPEGELREALKNSISKLWLGGFKALALTVVIVAVVLATLAFIMRNTDFGNNFYIAGDNAEAGKLAGINIPRAQFFAYVLCGLLCGLAGVFLASNSGAAVYTQGEGRDVFAISACVIGGIKMAGGKGTMLNVLIGILIMRIISTGMNLMLLPSAWVDFVSGVLLIVVLVIDKVTSVKTEDA